MRALSPRVVLLGSIAATLLLYWLPFGRRLAWPLILLSTLAHELGHGIAAMLVGARFERFEIFLDGSGVAHYGGAVSPVGAALIRAGGLVGPAIAAAICFVAARGERRARAALVTIGAGLLVAEMLVVDNLFGLCFVGLVAVACLALAGWGGAVARWALMFGGVQLALSVYSRSDYLFARTSNRGLSDVAAMAEVLGAPFWVWGIACGLCSLVVLAFGLWAAWRR